MYKIYALAMEYRIRVFINSLIYFFRRLPVIKNKFQNHSYRYVSFKRLVVKIAPVVNLLIITVKTMLSIIILYFISRLGLVIGVDQLLVFSSLYLGDNLVRYEMVEYKLEIFKFFSYFNMDPGSFTKSRIFLENGFKTLARIISLLLLRIFLEIPLAFCVIFPLVLLTLTLLSNVFFTALTHRGHFVKNWMLTLSTFSLMALLGVGLWALSVDVLVLFSNPLWLLGFLPMLMAARWIYNYQHYRNDFVKYILPSADEMQQVGNVKETNKATLSLKEEDLDVERSRALVKYQGYRLLNNLFFERHRRLLLKPILFKSALVGVVLILGILGVLYLRLFNQAMIQDLPEVLMNSLPGIIPFFSYMLFNQDKISRVMFLNCDLAFLEYGFYKRAPDLLKMFTLRLLKIIQYNALPTGIIILGLTVIFWLLEVPFTSMLPILLQVMALMVFFSVHTLFVYYIFQPYTSDMDVKNPFFYLTNSVIYLICFLTLQMDLSGPMLPPIFIGAAVIYSLVALILVYKKAPKTFKIVQ